MNITNRETEGFLEDLEGNEEEILGNICTEMASNGGFNRHIKSGKFFDGKLHPT